GKALFVLHFHGVEDAAVGVDADQKGVLGSEIDHSTEIVIREAGGGKKRRRQRESRRQMLRYAKSIQFKCKVVTSHDAEPLKSIEPQEVPVFGDDISGTTLQRGGDDRIVVRIVLNISRHVRRRYDDHAHHFQIIDKAVDL